MILSGFKNIVMSALFGELAGYDRYLGITHLSYGEGIESWDSGTVPTLSILTSGMEREVYRNKIEEIYFLNQVIISGTNFSGCSTSGLIVNLSEGYPSYHFNELKISMLSGTQILDRIIQNYSLESGTISFYSGVTGLTSKSQITSGVINDVIALGGTPTNNLLFKCRARSNETQFRFIREEGLVGAGATDQPGTGSFANLVRFIGRPTFGQYFEASRDYRFSVGSGFFIK